ncbi:late competence development ComFB family protein [Bacillus sp. B190/17]|uniref:Late competence development ComFB family protein n=1 Tax=Bacillus lumedeiriae TaxID=3058829 RepID=A0ABW8IB53_9BACI
MAVHNVMEDVVKGIIADQLNHLHLSCTCERCQEDILALSLNKILPRYIVNDNRRPLVKAMYMVNTQDHANLVAVVAQSAATVSANARCGNIV